jgi:general secretion pathway protein I
MTSRCERGFSVLEVLVAFAIAASALVVIFGVASHTADEDARSRDLATATMLAESLYAESGVSPYVDTPVRSGTYGDRFQWRVTTFTRSETAPMALRQIRIDVSWLDRGKQRAFRFIGLKPKTVRALP